MSVGAHIFAGFSMGYSHKSSLVKLRRDAPSQMTIHNLDPVRLMQEGVQVLALDFDGVLAHHGCDTPLPEAIAWLSRCVEIFGGDRIFILSNKPTEKRAAWFSAHFPAMRFISGVRKKPFPDGLNKIGELAGVPLSSILMVDDRLLTGCLAAINAGARPCWINQPYYSFTHRPVAELFFMLIRRLERLIIGIIA